MALLDDKELLPFFGNPNIQRQGARARALAAQRDVNTLPDPRTYAAVSGLLGTAPDQMGFSVLNPQYESIMQTARPAFATGTALGVAPLARVFQAPAMALGRAGERMAERVVPQIMQRGGLPADLLQGMSRGTVSPLDVFHGTPHTLPPTARNPLGEFDASKIGTGEGAQAYGFGIYTAENPAVAGGYRDKLQKVDYSGSQIDPANPSHVALATMEKFGDTEKASAYLKQRANLMDYDINMQAAKLLDDKAALPTRNAYGSLYKADLPDAMIAKMLDYDKPLSKQPEIMKALTPEAMGLKLRVSPQSGYMGYVSPDGVPIGLQVKGATPENFRKRWLERIAEFGDAEGGAGRVIGYLGGTSETSAAQVSEALRQAGIPGIKYLDELSRAKGKGTRNFVTFPGEEKNLRILERNGLLGD
jgi:hypothetical protein